MAIFMPWKTLDPFFNVAGTLEDLRSAQPKLPDLVNVS
jgi:hypothetical protein